MLGITWPPPSSFVTSLVSRYKDSPCNQLGNQVSIAPVREKVKRLEDLLEVEKQGRAIAISNAELKAMQGSSFALLARYKDGLRDGASLSRGGSLSAATATPDSAQFAEQSPM